MNYGPPASSKIIFFIDDLNLPALDAYNTQSAIALIRQHIDYGHWYEQIDEYFRLDKAVMPSRGMSVTPSEITRLPRDIIGK